MTDSTSADLLIVITSFANSHDAQVMAHQLIEKKLAACVQIQDSIQSVYRWDGAICQEKECVLTAKTIASKWQELRTFIKSTHPYALPELIGITPSEYDEAYGRWVQVEVDTK